MPTEPIREQLIAAIEARLKAITAGATYFFTPCEVGRDWKNFNELPNLAPKRPYYAVLDGRETRPPSTFTQIKATFSPTIIGWVKHDTDRRKHVNEAIADVIRSIYTDEEWAGLALVTNVTEIITDEAALVAKPYAYFEVTLQIEYMVDRSAA